MLGLGPTLLGANTDARQTLCVRKAFALAGPPPFRKERWPGHGSPAGKYYPADTLVRIAECKKAVIGRAGDSATKVSALS